MSDENCGQNTVMHGKEREMRVCMPLHDVHCTLCHIGVPGAKESSKLLTPLAQSAPPLPRARAGYASLRAMAPPRRPSQSPGSPDGARRTRRRTSLATAATTVSKRAGGATRGRHST